MFQGRKLLIATKHEKEKVIAPIFEKSLGVKCFVPEKFDTDKFGTFTGEKERKQDPISTARAKCFEAMELYNCDLAIASEGSFGAHPAIFFVPADDEILLFIDKKNDLEIIAREISIDTNFNGAEIKSENELLEFAKQAKFPSHGLIIRNTKDDIVKGITNQDQLLKVFNYFIKNYGSAFIETDMRAMFNPTRLGVIEKVSEKLVAKIKSLCPNCNTPGFEITDSKSGLPCLNCGLPTQSVLSHIYSCQKCSFIHEDKYPLNKFNEDPMYCKTCNP